MEPSSDATQASLPVGRSARLEALALTAAGDHAVLVRETTPSERARALLTTDKLAAGERLVIMPLDDDVEVRVDGDALAVWLGAGSLAQLPPDQRPVAEHAHVPPWATIVGGALLAADTGLRRHRLRGGLHLALAPAGMSDRGSRPPDAGLAGMRIGLEYGSGQDFAEGLQRALARGGEQGATLVAALDRGDLSVHLPRVDGPCWNSVPLFHLHRGEEPTDEDWATTSGILEKLERYR